MNTNSNVYTVIYTTLVVVVVAAVLAFVAMKLGPSQQANEKAETLRQMMVAAQVGSADEIYAARNAEVLKLYADNIEKAFTINLDGEQTGELSVSIDNIELVSNLKPVDKAIKNGAADNLPVYQFKGGISVIPVYGAGLWGPIWGYVAIGADGQTIKGVYFDHASETPGLGAKIKDEPWFREKFAGKKAAFSQSPIFTIAKNAEADGAENAVDAITGATMTSKGLNAAVNTWFDAYRQFFGKAALSGHCCGRHGHAEGECCCGGEGHCAEGSECCGKGQEGCCNENNKAEEE